MGEGVGRSQSVIVVRDDLGVLEIFANQFESKAETAHKICGLAQKWQIGDWMGPPTLRYQGNVDGPFRHVSSPENGWPHPVHPVPPFPGTQSYVWCPRNSLLVSPELFVPGIITMVSPDSFVWCPRNS